MLAALLPLGLQYHGNTTARTRVAAFTTSVEAMRIAPGPVSDGIEAVGPSAPTRLSTSRAPEGIDLAEWAELLGKREPGSAAEMAKMLRVQTSLGSLDADVVEGLVLAAEQMDLPPAKRMGLINALISQ